MLFDLLILNNLHYIVIVFSGLAFFAAGWLYLDAWKLEPETNFNWVKTIGFFLLAVSTWLQVVGMQEGYIVWLNLTEIIGLLILVISYSLEPLQPKPKKNEGQNVIFPLNLAILGTALYPLSTALYIALAISLWRREGEGLEKQLKWLAIAITSFALAEATGIFKYGNFSQGIIWSQFIATYGPLWFMEHALQLFGLSALIGWVWQYIRFRTAPQIQLVTISIALTTLTVSALVFSYFLFYQFKETTLSHLKTDVNLVQYSMESIQQENQAEAKQIAGKIEIRQAVANREEGLVELLGQAALNYDQNTLAVLNESGEVLARIDEYEMPFTPLQQKLINKALQGETITTLAEKVTPLHPLIEIYSATPIYSSEDIDKKIGVLLAGNSIDSAFVENLKEVTGMEITLYAGEQRAATTLSQSKEAVEILGTTVSNTEVAKIVMDEGNVFAGNDTVLGQPYFAAYAPLKSYQDETIGMIFAGKPHLELERAAQDAILRSMVVNSLLVIISIIPASFIARAINKHLKA